jgi:pyruvate,water dikinase
MRDLTSSIAPLNQLTPADEPRAGGKAYNCARLEQAGFPVPDGLVVLSIATDDEVDRIASHPWFDGVPDDALFAVRSSGIGEDSPGQSFAGIHHTLLNVPRADLPAAITSCRASARSPQAIAYRKANALSTSAIDIAVLIQLMVNPRAAGVAFTANPLTGATDEMVINSSWGLGEALVSGQIDPDEFVVAKDTGEVRWSRIGEKDNSEAADGPSLTADHLRELAVMLNGIEHHYSAPQDVEWCHDGARFWIVQSRPITTARGHDAETEWTRANLAEVLPDLTSPQALVAFEDLLNRAEHIFLGNLAGPDDELGPMVKAFGGRLYFNLSQLRHVCAVAGVPAAMMLKSMGHAATIHPEDEHAVPVGLRKRLATIPTLLRLATQHMTTGRVMRKHNARIRSFLKRFESQDASALSDRELWALIEQSSQDMAEFMQPVLLLSGVLFHEAPLRKLLARLGVTFEELVYPQLAAGERSVSAQQAFDLAALATTARRESAINGTRFLAEFKRFIEEYGHRGRYESDWSLPRYREDTAPLLAAIAAHGQDAAPGYPAAIRFRQDRDAADAWRAFEQRLSPIQRVTVLPRVRKSVQIIKRYYVWREQVRSDLMKMVGVFRTWHLVLAKRFVKRGWIATEDDYFLITLPEIAAVLKGEGPSDTLAAIVAARTRERERFRLLRMPLLMRESELPRLLRTSGVSDDRRSDTELTGQPVSGGCVEAEVVVIRDPGDFGRMKRGAILVAPATDPSWTPLFTLASGVIVEVGGVLSHASTIAREYGLPAIANVKNATRRLRTGERVRLDAVRGVIEKVAR